MQRSCNILMKVITKAADSDKSVDVLRYYSLIHLLHSY